MRTCIAIDLKSFYASVECVDRGLDPLTANLVVADESRTEKTICLAVSPSLKAYGISGRARLFEVVQRVGEINKERKSRLPGKEFSGESFLDPEVRKNPSLALSYIAAPPRMSLYMDYSTRIFNIYLRYVSSEDMHVYSVDEVFLDVTGYLKTFGMTAEELAREMVRTVWKETGITATAGIGTNLYLAKIAMDIVAKHMEPDEYGTRLAELDEYSYRRLLWDHTPITDFWRIGKGYARKLAQNGMYTMGDVALCSIGEDEDFYNENLLYELFGINAELLIDHAWGYEPCTIEEIRRYRPTDTSLSSGQVLKEPYPFDKGKLILKEMTDLLALDLVDKGLLTDQLVLYVGYDIENLTREDLRKSYKGEITEDYYGRQVPKAAHGSENLGKPTSSAKKMIAAAEILYERIVNPKLLIRRLSITANHTISEQKREEEEAYEQLSLFTDTEAEERALEKEKNLQKAVLSLKKKFGKNAVLKGMNLEEGATTIERNGQVGGHRA